MVKKNILRNQLGFTLIEIIAVLVLLGILAAVAVPKYLSMQEAAEFKAVASVKAELAARANQYHGVSLLDPTHADAAKATQAIAAWAAEDIGTDYTTAVSGANIKVTVNSTNKSYLIPFTAGTATTAATFGTIVVAP